MNRILRKWSRAPLWIFSRFLVPFSTFCVSAFKSLWGDLQTDTRTQRREQILIYKILNELKCKMLKLNRMRKMEGLFIEKILYPLLIIYSIYHYHDNLNKANFSLKKHFHIFIILLCCNQVKEFKYFRFFSLAIWT